MLSSATTTQRSLYNLVFQRYIPSKGETNLQLSFIDGEGVMDYAEKVQRCHEYVEALEEEKRKIQVFQRELPLCLELVTQAIEACRRELSGTTTEFMHEQSECSDQTSSDAPVLEEFIPLKRVSSQYGNENDEQHPHKPEEKNIIDKKKSDWLRSVQLWNQSPDSPSKEDVPRKATVVEVKGNGGAFQPFHREKSEGKAAADQARKGNNSSVLASATSSTTEPRTVSKGGDCGKKGDQEAQLQRKQRRCWSPELHKRFLHALQHLGGSHAATPKQIRELMKVDGLTNDEVKSHLQKYRLHTRRPNPTIHNNANPRAPQFVVVGGIWVPPSDYLAVAAKASGEVATAAGTNTNGVYAPVAAPARPAPQSLMQRSQQAQFEHLQSEDMGSHSEDARHSSSPSTSSSTHTTTSSPVFN